MPTDGKPPTDFERQLRDAVAAGVKETGRNVRRLAMLKAGETIGALNRWLLGKIEKR